MANANQSTISSLTGRPKRKYTKSATTQTRTGIQRGKQKRRSSPGQMFTLAQVRALIGAT